MWRVILWWQNWTVVIQVLQATPTSWTTHALTKIYSMKSYKRTVCWRATNDVKRLFTGPDSKHSNSHFDLRRHHNNRFWRFVSRLERAWWWSRGDEGSSCSSQHPRWKTTLCQKSIRISMVLFLLINVEKVKTETTHNSWRKRKPITITVMT